MSPQAPTHEAGGALWTRYVELEMERTAITDGTQDDPEFERYQEIRDQQHRLRVEMGESLFGELSAADLMGGRTRPNWAFFVGGPLDGTKSLLNPGQGAGPVIKHTPSPTPGMVVPHEYLVTSERRKGGFHEADARVARYVRTFPEEPAPAPPPLSTSMPT